MLVTLLLQTAGHTRQIWGCLVAESGATILKWHGVNGSTVELAAAALFHQQMSQLYSLLVQYLFLVPDSSTWYVYKLFSCEAV